MCVLVLLRAGVSFLVMNGRRLVNSEFDFSGEQGKSADSRLAAHQDDSAAAIDDALRQPMKWQQKALF